MPVQAVIWDIGGVLVRTEDRGPRTHLAARLGMTYAELENLIFNSPVGMRAQLGQVSSQECWAEACRALHLPETQAESFKLEFFSGDRLDAHLVAYIRALHAHYRTGIISNAMDDVRQEILQKWRMADAFDAILVSAEVGIVKPDERIFRLALQALDVSPAQAVFIDDFQLNVASAQNIGMQAIHFRNLQQVREELEGLLKDSS